MLILCAINCEIVEEDLHKSGYIFAEDFCDDVLKCCRIHCKPEHHCHSYEHAPILHKSGVLLIIRMYTDLIIATEAIHFVPDYGIEYAIYEGKGKSICNYYRIEFLIVDADSNFSVFLWYVYNRTQPRSLLDRSDLYVSHMIRVHAVTPLLDGLCIRCQV